MLEIIWREHKFLTFLALFNLVIGVWNLALGSVWCGLSLFIAGALIVEIPMLALWKKSDREWEKLVEDVLEASKTSSWSGLKL